MPLKSVTLEVSQAARPVSEVMPWRSLNMSFMVMGPAVLAPMFQLPICTRASLPSTPVASRCWLMSNMDEKSVM